DQPCHVDIAHLVDVAVVALLPVRIPLGVLRVRAGEARPVGCGRTGGEGDGQGDGEHESHSAILCHSAILPFDLPAFSVDRGGHGTSDARRPARWPGYTGAGMIAIIRSSDPPGAAATAGSRGQGRWGFDAPAISPP